MPECLRKLVPAIWTASWSVHSHKVRGFLRRGASKISSCSPKSRSRLPQLFKAWLRSTIQLKVATRSSCTAGVRFPRTLELVPQYIADLLSQTSFHFSEDTLWLAGCTCQERRTWWNSILFHSFSKSNALSGSLGGIRLHLTEAGQWEEVVEAVQW